jgi:hypothetical protein
VFGDADANATAGMPAILGADNSVTGINYFVYNNTEGGPGGGPAGNSSWNYFFDYGTAQFSFTVSTSGVVPEPATWVMMAAGFAGLGFVGYRRSRKLAVA